MPTFKTPSVAVPAVVFIPVRKIRLLAVTAVVDIVIDPAVMAALKPAVLLAPVVIVILPSTVILVNFKAPEKSPAVPLPNATEALVNLENPVLASAVAIELLQP